MLCFGNQYRVFLTILVLMSSYQISHCEGISNKSFNASLRDYTAGGGSNVTNVKTLQKEDIEKHAYFTPAGTPIKFKETSDSTLSSSSKSNSRGLLFHDHPGYVLNDYEEGPHFGYGNDYHFQEPRPDLHGLHNYEQHNYEPQHFGGYHHFDHGHYKFNKHALATKAALWPLAGIALLGAAALVVSNPVLLQLGVVSGKRRRRDTEEITGPDFPMNSIKKYSEKIKKINSEPEVKINNALMDNFNNRILNRDNGNNKKPVNRYLRNNILASNNQNVVKRVPGKKGLKSSKPTVDQFIGTTERYDSYHNDDERFIPIPLKLRSPNVSEP